MGLSQLGLKVSLYISHQTLYYHVLGVVSHSSASLNKYFSHADLRNRLETSELECQRVSDNLEQMTAQKMALERDVATLQKQNVGLRASNETLVRSVIHIELIVYLPIIA